MLHVLVRYKHARLSSRIYCKHMVKVNHLVHSVHDFVELHHA